MPRYRVPFVRTWTIMQTGWVTVEAEDDLEAMERMTSFDITQRLIEEGTTHRFPSDATLKELAGSCDGSEWQFDETCDIQLIEDEPAA